MAMTNARSASRPLGIVLLQLGGPASLDDVQPFLESMFRDPELFDLPLPDRLRNWLARKLSSWRATKARPLYSAIGGKSPIVDTTYRQAALLERALRVALPCRVFVAMRYGSPSTASTVQAVHEAGLGRLLILPLYPQYSSATTGSSTKEWDRLCREEGLAIPTDRVDSYCSFPPYIDALADQVDEGLGRFPVDSRPHIVFSAHGLPVRLVRRGDPYQRQIEETTRLVVDRCAPNLCHTLCYQSRIGPGQWLRPSLTDTLRRLGRAGTGSVLVVPVSFVSDHLETLVEIDIEARREAARWGIGQFETMQGLNDSPAFIDALAQLVLNHVANADSG